MSNDMPLVSAVIPTYRRPDLLLRAVRSALAQTERNIEVLVVMDGPDEITAASLDVIRDERLRVLALAANSGASAARNLGIEAARAEWIAFLDDDDEWLPEKLAIQHTTATRSAHRYPIVSCRFIARTRRGDLVWPRRLPDPGERIDEYLFCQRSLFGGEGMVLPTTIFTRTELARRVPFAAQLRRHGDIDWLIQIAQIEGCGVEFVPDARPLAIWNLDEASTRISSSSDWGHSLNWVLANRDLLSQRAIAGFVLTWTSLAAAADHRWKAFFRLPVEAFRLGKPRLIDLCAHLLIWFIPTALRNRISILMQSRKRT